MPNLLRGVVLGTVVVALVATVATAERQVTVESVGEIVARPIDLGNSVAGATCQVGNLNPPAWAIVGFLTPPEDYKLVFFPRATCSACRSGFRVTDVHVILQTHDACTLRMSADVEKAVLQSPGCYMPGAMVCRTGLYDVTIPSAGLWNVGIPVYASDCPASPGGGCLSMFGGGYCLSVHFESAGCTSGGIDLVTDDGPASLCLNWNNYGAGWYDLVGVFPSWPGQLKIYAGVACCQHARAGTAPPE